VELELENGRQEVTRVGEVRGDVILGARVEELFTSCRWRSDALILQAQIPPRLVVVVRRDLSAEDLPPPLIDQQPEGQERNLGQRLLQQQPEIARGVRRLREQPD